MYTERKSNSSISNYIIEEQRDINGSKTYFL